MPDDRDKQKNRTTMPSVGGDLLAGDAQRAAEMLSSLDLSLKQVKSAYGSSPALETAHSSASELQRIFSGNEYLRGVIGGPSGALGPRNALYYPPTTFLGALPSVSSQLPYGSQSDSPWTGTNVLFRNRWAHMDLLDVEKTHKLRQELEGRIRDKQKELEQAFAKSSAKLTAEVKEREKTIEELSDLNRVQFLLQRVRPEAHRHILQDAEFQKRFLSEGSTNVFVMSVDIRRSTELMLKARTPKDFARFITELCQDLMTVVTDSFGVVDKFTGDGILAFFPDFYSGPDSGLWAVSAAERCHNVFRERYAQSRKYFAAVLKDVGLGIGIDCGAAHLVKVADGLTVVGEPVVYSCRLSGAPAGSTFLNQPAYEAIASKYSDRVVLSESSLSIKNEGEVVTYLAKLTGKPIEPALPNWMPREPGPEKK